MEEVRQRGCLRTSLPVCVLGHLLVLQVVVLLLLLRLLVLVMLRMRYMAMSMRLVVLWMLLWLARVRRS